MSDTLYPRDNLSKEDIDLINECIEICSSTNYDDWCTDRVMIDDNGKTRCCFLGHIFTYWSNEKDESYANHKVSHFMSVWATEYMFYPVNDGEDGDYPQSQPKDRILAYLTDLRDGRTPNISDLNKELSDLFDNQ